MGRPLTRRRVHALAPRLGLLGATAAATAATAAVAGCGPGAGAPPVASDAPVTLRLGSWLTAQPSVDVYEQELIAPFRAQHPNTTIAVERTADVTRYTERLQAQAVAGDLPDLLEVHFAFFPEFVKAGWFESLDARLKRDRINPADYDRTATGMGRWPYGSGPFYSWWTMMGVGTFYYNRTLFEREGVAPPDARWTWDQALDAARKLTRPGQQWGLQLPSYVEGFVYAFGGQILSEDGTRCLLDRPESVRAHQFLADLFLRHGVHPTAAELRDAGVQGDAFGAGRVGMYLHGSHLIGRFRQEATDLAWDIAPAPQGPAGRFAAVAGNPSHAVAAAGKSRDRAWEFLRWWIAGQTSRQVVSPGSLPSKTSALRGWLQEAQQHASPRSIALVLETLERHGRPTITGLRWSEWSEIWRRTRDALNAGQTPVEQGLREATRQIDLLLKG